LNFIVTVHTMRAGNDVVPLAAVRLGTVCDQPGDDIATPVIAITVLLLAIERFVHVGIFDPSIGGDPILFQHMFWFYSHPAVYIMILPGMYDQRLISNFRERRYLIRVYCVLEHCDRRLRFLVGTPHVRGAVDLCGTCFLVPDDGRRRAVGH
jgi:hypothetical protein